MYRRELTDNREQRTSMARLDDGQLFCSIHLPPWFYVRPSSAMSSRVVHLWRNLARKRRWRELSASSVYISRL